MCLEEAPFYAAVSMPTLQSATLYRHFERSEKSLSFAAWRSMIGNSKRETCYPLTFGHRPIYICGEAATFTPHSSFWSSFHPQSRNITPPGPTLNPEPKTFFKNQLTQRRQCGKIIPVADEAAPFERAMQKISKKSFDKPLRM